MNVKHAWSSGSMGIMLDRREETLMIRVTGTQARLHTRVHDMGRSRAQKYNYICTNFRELLTAGASAGQNRVGKKKERRM